MIELKIWVQHKIVNDIVTVVATWPWFRVFRENKRHKRRASKTTFPKLFKIVVFWYFKGGFSMYWNHKYFTIISNKILFSEFITIDYNLPNEAK